MSEDQPRRVATQVTQHVSQRKVNQPVTAPHPYYSNLKSSKNKTDLAEMYILKYGLTCALWLVMLKPVKTRNDSHFKELSAKQCKARMYRVTTDLLSLMATLVFPVFFLENMMTAVSAKMAQLGPHSAADCLSFNYLTRLPGQVHLTFNAHNERNSHCTPNNTSSLCSTSLA